MAINLENWGKETKEKKIRKCKYCIDNFLKDAGWEYNRKGIYIPYNIKSDDKEDNIYLNIRREEDTRKKIELVFTWTEKNGNTFKPKRSFSFNNPLNIGKEKILDELIELISYSGKLNKNPGDDENYTTFTNDFIEKIINSEGLSILKKVKYKSSSDKKEKEKEPKVEDKTDETFDNYPEIIQDEALKIINEDTLFDKIKDSISLTHEGNEKLKKRLPLIIASIFVGEPVQTEINADTGQGKTDNAVETVKNFPQQYVKILRTISPKNIYYDRESYGDYNILIFDDVVLTESIIEVLKELSDNKKPVKELRTVIDGKSQTFTLPGKYLLILTYAKGNYDEELLNRLYKLNIILDDGDAPKIKKKILDNAIIDVDNNSIISRNRLIMKAAIQHLIEKKIKVFNPFTFLFNPEKYSNRDIKVFVSLVNSKTFFHIGKRKRIEINGNNYYIGSFEDYEYVEEIWKDDNKVQKYKLNDKQLKILKILPEKTATEAYKDCQNAIDEYEIVDSEYEKNKILEEQYTRKRIAKEIGINESTVRNYIDKSSGTAKTLLDSGLIGRIPFKISENHSPYIYYKIKNDEDDPDSDKSGCHDCQIEYDTQFNTLYYKMKIIYGLFRLSNIIINEEGFNHIKKYCEEYDKELSIKDYDTYYFFISKLLINFNYNRYSINISEATFEEIDYMMGLEEKINNLKNNEDNIKNSYQDNLTAN